MNELERKWKECQGFETEFGDLKYHKEFYDLVKAKFIRENANNKNVVIFTPIKKNAKNDKNTKSYTNLHVKSYTNSHVKSNTKLKLTKYKRK